MIYLGLPAYNEEESIPGLFGRIRAAMQDLGEPLTVLLYNDGCRDRTVEEAQAWQDRLRLQVLEGHENKGLGEGLRQLVSHACQHAQDDDALVIMDCDDTHDPAQISVMRGRMADGYDIVIASRYRRGSTTEGVPPVRLLMSWGAVAAFRLIYPLSGVLDYTCGYRMYRASFLRKVWNRFGSAIVENQGFACMPELLVKAAACDARMTEIPLRLRYDRKLSSSKMDVSANATRLLRLLWHWRISGLDASSSGALAAASASRRS